MFKNLINTKLPSYRGRRLKAGEAFSAPRGDAKVYVALGLAKYDTDEAFSASEPMASGGTYNRRDMVASPVEQGSIKTLRAEYKKLVGKRPFNGWDATELRAKINAAKGS